jgi:hypothetical protein
VTARTPGQVAYEEWAGRVIPPFTLPWEKLPLTGNDGWQKIAAAVLAHDAAQRAARQCPKVMTAIGLAPRPCLLDRDHEGWHLGAGYSSSTS